MVHVLYLEDEPNDAQLVERYLKSVADTITLRVARDIPAAELALAEEPSLVLVDIMIGNARSGLEFVRTLRDDGYHMDVIAITALTLPREIEQCLESGCSVVITKPFSIGELDRVLSQYL